MNDIIGIAWYRDELTYHKALKIFTDPESMPTTFQDWSTLVKRELELIKDKGNIPLRADIDPEAFAAWCASRGFNPNSEARTAFVTHIEIEYQKTGKGTVIE